MYFLSNSKGIFFEVADVSQAFFLESILHEFKNFNQKKITWNPNLYSIS